MNAGYFMMKKIKVQNSFWIIMLQAFLKIKGENTEKKIINISGFFPQ
jgi:hypothetical protein